MRELSKVLGILMVLAWTGNSQAATITVNSLADDGPGNCDTSCTLRDAIALSAAGDTIVVPMAGTVTLESAKGEIGVSHSLTIVGAGETATKISGNDATRIFNVTEGLVTFGHLSLINGRSTGEAGGSPTPGSYNGSGGAIRVGELASVVLLDVTLENNQAIGGRGGDGYNTGRYAGGGGGGVGGRGASNNYSNTAALNSEPGGFGGGGGGSSYLSGNFGSAGGFGGGGGGSNSTGAPGTGGTGGGNGGYGSMNGFGGGGGGAGLGGALYIEGSLTMRNVTFRSNEARGGAGGSGLGYGGGGGGGGGLGSAYFSRTGSDICDRGNVGYVAGSVTGGAGGLGGASGGGGGGNGTGLETSTGRYELGTNNCTVNLLEAKRATITARQTEQAIFLAAQAWPVEMSGHITFQIFSLNLEAIGAPVTASVVDGQAYVFYNAMITEAGTYYIQAKFTDATATYDDSLTIGILMATPAPILLRTEVIEPGDACTEGGLRIYTGRDDGLPSGVELDGILQDGEVDETTQLCNGVDGSDGADGYASLITVTATAPAEICAEGGYTIHSGLDDGAGGGTANDGILQSGEIDATSYVCHGTAGTNGVDGIDGVSPPATLVTVTAVPLDDASCPTGGQRIDAGPDDGSGGGTAYDGILQVGEIDATTYVCNGADGGNGLNGTNGSDGTDGTNGADGESGLDGAQGNTGPQGPAGEGGCASGGDAGSGLAMLALLSVIWMRRRFSQV